MERVPVHGSSNVAEIGYEEDTRLLEIQFSSRKGPGSVYQYAGVPLSVWHELLRAPSKGVFFSDRVKGAYPVTKIS